jgi:hypothetical protein
VSNGRIEHAMRRLIFLLSALVCGPGVVAQGPSLIDLVAQQQADVAVTINVDGPPAAWSRTLEATDHVVRAITGKAVGHLSEDGRDINTTVELGNPQVLFSATVARLRLPGPGQAPMVLTRRGGTVAIGGFTATVMYDDVVRLNQGMDVIVLLHEDGSKFVPVDRSAIFEVRGSTVVPLDRIPGEHQRFKGMSPGAFISEVIALRQQLSVK